jgi:hypothetical protein
MSRGEFEYCVLTGSPIDGFEVSGPFDTHDEACEWASELAEGWWVMVLNAPEESDE